MCLRGLTPFNAKKVNFLLGVNTKNSQNTVNMY